MYFWSGYGGNISDFCKVVWVWGSPWSRLRSLRSPDYFGLNWIYEGPNSFLILLNYFFDPLFAFSIYFCFLHSVRNVYKTKEFKLNSTSINLISFITFILLIIVFSYLYNRLDLLQSLNYTIFIGLAALTFPHIATDIIYNQLNSERK